MISGEDLDEMCKIDAKMCWSKNGKNTLWTHYLRNKRRTI